MSSELRGPRGRDIVEREREGHEGRRTVSRLNQFHSCFAIFSLFLTAVIHAINMINPIISASAAPRPEYFIFAGLVFTPLTVDASAAIDQPRALLEMPGGEKRLLVKFAKISPPNMFRQLFMMDSSHLSLSLYVYINIYWKHLETFPHLAFLSSSCLRIQS